MANLTKDVYRGYKFSVQIDGFKRASFQKVTGMKSSVEVVEYREGNMPDRMEKLAGMMTYDSVTLERGISGDDDFRSWMETVCDVLNGAGNTPVASSSNSLNDFGATSYRKNVIIQLHDKSGAVVKKYTLLNAWPSEYTIGDFDATSNDVVISSLVLQHHGIKEENINPTF
jgi:phage tail-like protein